MFHVKESPRMPQPDKLIEMNKEIAKQVSQVRKCAEQFKPKNIKK